MGTFFVIVLMLVALIAGLAFKAIITEQDKVAKMSEEERRRYIEEKQQQNQNVQDSLKYGQLSPMIICQQCQTKGKVRTKQVQHKKGVSGGKATAALLTAGVSLLAVGLSRKEGLTEARCGNCQSVWHF